MKRIRTQLHKGKTTVIWWSVLPRRIRVKLNTSVPVRWLRIGLLPGRGEFHEGGRIFCALGAVVIRAPEARSCTVEVMS